MVTAARLLPGNATVFERALVDAGDPDASLAPRFEDVRHGQRVTPAAFLPFVVWQYGLGELIPYVPALNQLIEEGIRWQRVRGTPRAIEMGLGWLGHTGEIEEAEPRRRRWNRFMLELGALPSADLPDLQRIAGVVQLSPPARSRFSRGFRIHDVRAAETGYSRTSSAIVGDDSGVRVAGVDPKWSFGRVHETSRALGRDDLHALGAWIEPVATSGLWVDMATPWVGATYLWSVAGEVARRSAMARRVAELPAWVRFRAADQSIIGHARAHVLPVREAVDGLVRHGAGRFAVDPAAPTAILVQTRTAFGDGVGSTARHASLVFGARLDPALKPGLRWVGSSPTRLRVQTAPTTRLYATGDLVSGGVELAAHAIDIQFRATVRERVSVLLTL